MVSFQKRLKELRDPPAKNLYIAHHRQDAWLQNRANFLDNAIRALRPAAHGLDHVFDLVKLLVGAGGGSAGRFGVLSVSRLKAQL